MSVYEGTKADLRDTSGVVNNETAFDLIVGVSEVIH